MLFTSPELTPWMGWKTIIPGTQHPHRSYCVTAEDALADALWAMGLKSVPPGTITERIE